MATEYQKLQAALQRLSGQQREAWSIRFRCELATARETDDILDSLTPAEQDRLRQMIADGTASRDAAPLDMDEIIRRNEARWDTL